jgi:SAM-dependent methyltransferase
MRTYVNAKGADEALEGASVLTYPHLHSNQKTFPPIPGGLINGPSHLVVEGMHLLAERPRTILDLGSMTCANATYLAAHGHCITAVDNDDMSLGMGKFLAQEVGVPDKNLKTVQMDMRDLPRDNKYDVVLSRMALHFLEEEEAQATLEVMREVTNPGGFNIVSAYTSDNPAEEITMRGLRYMFRPGELAAGYRRNGWQMHRDVEGLLPKKVSRDMVYTSSEPVFLVPTVAEVIAQKP